jgi:hypothetical protein
MGGTGPAEPTFLPLIGLVPQSIGPVADEDVIRAAADDSAATACHRVLQQTRSTTRR